VVSAQRLEQAAAQGVDVAAVEAELVGIAARLPVQRLRAVVHYYTERLDPDGTEPDPTEGRQLSMSRLLDGRWRGTVELDAIGGEKLATALEAIADLHLASGQLPTLRTVKPQLIVTIGADDLVDPATGPGAARTGMDGRISAATARWPACDGRISRMLIDADGLPLDVGREERVVPRTFAAPSSNATACSPAAKHPTGGATSPTSTNGSPTTATPHSTTPPIVTTTPGARAGAGPSLGHGPMGVSCQTGASRSGASRRTSRTDRRAWASYQPGCSPSRGSTAARSAPSPGRCRASSCSPTWQNHPSQRGLGTHAANSGLLCERHHTKAHHGYRVERDDTAPPEHRWHTYRPDGSEIILTGSPHTQ
jgi:hypothetical protein